MSNPMLDSNLAKEAENESTVPDRLFELCQHIELCHIIASNQNIDIQIAERLAPRYPLELLANPTFRELEESGRLLPALSLVSRLSLLIASSDSTDAFTRFQIRDSLIQALRSVSRLRIKRIECWYSRFHFMIRPGVIDSLPNSEVAGHIDDCSEEYGEIVEDLHGIEREISALLNLQEDVSEILDDNEDISCQDIPDRLDTGLARLLSALSSGQVDQLVSQGFIQAEYGDILEEISIEHTGSTWVECTLASNSSGRLTDDMTMEIDGLVLELRYTEEQLTASWQSLEGEREVDVDIIRDPSGCNSHVANVTLDGLGALNLIWGWTPCVRNSSVPDDWCQFIVDGLIREAIANC